MKYENERGELDYFYGLAREELAGTGEKLVVWAGGDAPNQQDGLMGRFRERFPDVPIEVRVDLSKYHDIRVYQGLLDGRLEADVVMLQTMNDFEDWKAMGVLEPFLPQSFERLTPGYGDEEGAFLGAYMICFVPQYARSGLAEVPTGYGDFLRPEFKGHLVLTPPQDDDAVLFVYDHILRSYGEQFLVDLAGQEPHFLRGTAAPAALVGRRGFLGNITGYLTAPDQPAVAFIPERDYFISWPQRAAMFRLTRHKAAARLFLAYITSYEYQSALDAWSVREDVEPPTGLKLLAEYENTDPLEFVEWMRDRGRIHELRVKMEGVFGAVRGESPLTDPELLPIYRGVF